MLQEMYLKEREHFPCKNSDKGVLVRQNYFNGNNIGMGAQCIDLSSIFNGIHGMF